MRVRPLVSIVSVVFALVGAACSGGGEAPPTSSTGHPITVGAVAPPFTLPTAEGGDVSLADFIGKKPVLLFFSMGPG